MVGKGQEFTLTVTISADGETVETEVAGIKGSGCHALQEMFNKLGDELEHRQTAEYSQRAPVSIGQTTSRYQRLGR